MRVKSFIGDGNYYEIDSQGDIGWFNRNRVFHRLDGPAVVYKNGIVIYYIDGESLDRKNWEEDPRVKKALLKKKIENILDKIS